MPHDSDVAYVTATELARRVREREVSPVELVDTFAARIEERNPSLNAFVFTDFNGAREEAKRGALRSGSRRGGFDLADRPLYDL